MKPFIIRNDDVSYDTDLDSLQRFCEICDRHGFQILQAIIPMGEYKKSAARMTNQDIVFHPGPTKAVRENRELCDYLRNRNDLIGVHGLWHTHCPTEMEVLAGKMMLENLGFKPTWFVPPFNEGDYPDEVCGLKVSKLDQAQGHRLEDFLKRGTPQSEMMYLHSWRFGKWYKWSYLDRCLERLKS